MGTAQVGAGPRLGVYTIYIHDWVVRGSMLPTLARPGHGPTPPSGPPGRAGCPSATPGASRPGPHLPATRRLPRRRPSAPASTGAPTSSSAPPSPSCCPRWVSRAPTSCTPPSAPSPPPSWPAAWWRPTSFPWSTSAPCSWAQTTSQACTRHYARPARTAARLRGPLATVCTRRWPAAPCDSRQRCGCPAPWAHWCPVARCDARAAAESCVQSLLQLLSPCCACHSLLPRRALSVLRLCCSAPAASVPLFSSPLLSRSCCTLAQLPSACCPPVLACSLSITTRQANKSQGGRCVPEASGSGEWSMNGMH